MSRFKNRLPWHVGLMTGSMRSVRTLDGRVVQEFAPSKTNKYPVLAVLFERNPTLSQQEVLEREGLVQPPVKINRQYFSKNRSERRQLKHFKKLHREALKKAGFSPSARLNVSDPMVLRRG